MTTLNREIIRLLMHQVREEQSLRLSIARALGGNVAIPVPTDAEVDARIQELETVVKSNLTNQNKVV